MNKKVAFIHPDLGIGGGERLILDMALALKEENYNVDIYTNFHDKNRCFEETKSKLNVIVKGDIVPKKIFNRFQILWTIIRMIIASLYVIFFSKKDYDIIIVDQCPSPLLFLKLFTKSKIVFYCHYPDLLLVKNKEGIWRKIYRFFFDNFEKFMMRFVDIVCFNSNYSKSVSLEYFPFLSKKKNHVLYPTFKGIDIVGIKPKVIDSDFEYMLSINRYEEKKNITLAIKLFNSFKKDIKKNVKLIIAGGYNPELKDDIEYFNKLNELVKYYNLKDDVLFLKNITTEEKIWLIKNAFTLIYTPDFEHFGIVPIESMYYGTPVICKNNGGPLETVKNGVTGFYINDDINYSLEVLVKLYKKGKSFFESNCKNRVRNKFSFNEFKKKWIQIIN